MSRWFHMNNRLRGAKLPRDRALDIISEIMCIRHRGRSIDQDRNLGEQMP